MEIVARTAKWLIPRTIVGRKPRGGLTFVHHSVLATIWTVFGVLWVLPAIFGKRTVRRQATGTRILQLVLLVVAYVLMVEGRLGWNWLDLRLAPEGKTSTAFGYGLLFAGMAFAGWARLFLGSNWSSDVTLKENHTLVRSAPY